MFLWLDKLVQLFITEILNVSLDTRLGASLHFFFYDTLKILILLALMIFLISYIRSFFPPERTRDILSRFPGITGNMAAGVMGILTPFCSCSSVPLFIGFIEAGVPLGVTFSFLITSPIVNEAAFAVLLASFGGRIAILYVLAGVAIGITGGMALGALNLQDQVEAYVYEVNVGDRDLEVLTSHERVGFALDNVKDIIRRIWVFLLIGIGIGAAIHGYAPEAFLARYAGPGNPFSVLIAVAAGIPLYSNALGTIPIADALINKGVGVGTALAFMMAVTALSTPEMIILRKVIKPKLIAAFAGITGAGIVLVGYVFNSLVPAL